VPDTVDDAESVVNAPVPAVVEPIAPGEAKVAPFKLEAFRLATFVVEATVKGAVPVVSVEVITPVAEMVVNAPVLAVVAPTVPFKAPANLVAERIVPSNVNAAASCKSPPVPAYVTRPEVKPVSVMDVATIVAM
jgi:hypothetical protein